MKYWIFVSAPQNYSTVKETGYTAVGERGKEKFSRDVSVNDRFIVYLTQKMIFDGIGKFAGEVIFDKNLEGKGFPWKRKIAFEKTDLNKPARELFMGIEPFNLTNTNPGNLLTIMGGLVEISKKDFDWLHQQIIK